MLDAGLSEIARFFAQYRPFTEMTPEDLGDVVANAEIEFYPAGDVILSEDGGPVTFWRIIHSGAVDVAHEGKLLDLLGPGDTFGHAAMFSGLPPGFEARAAQDTLCYRIPVAVARPLLETVRSEDLGTAERAPAHLPVARLIRSPTLCCAPEQTISEVACQMTELDARCAIVDLQDGTFGIVTDRDLRTRVLAAGLPASAPVGEVMSVPAFTVLPDRLGGDVLFEMLERGIHHAPIVSSRGRLVGVVDEADLFAAQPRPWFGVRRAIARASDLPTLQRVASRLPTVLLELHSSSLKALDVARLVSALNDALVARAIELHAPDSSGAGLVWIALGSHARRELSPASSARGAFVLDEPSAPSWLQDAADALAGCGVKERVIARTGDGWLARAGSDPLALAVLIDRRPLWGTAEQALPVAGPTQREAMLEELAMAMHEYAPPTGFDGSALLDLAGRRSERFDIRRAAIAPIVALARWGALKAGCTDGSTLERLSAAAASGVYSEADARTLADAFELAYQLRIDHQLQQIAAGKPPDEIIDTAKLSGLTRSHLRDVFRAVTTTQRNLGR
ncbi:MAG: putative nucleotidyltransferase substrate binding domain-containing protein [Solirubrobacteraceae bacterium]